MCQSESVRGGEKQSACAGLGRQEKQSACAGLMGGEEAKKQSASARLEKERYEREGRGKISRHVPDWRGRKSKWKVPN